MITYNRRHPLVRFCRKTFYKIYNFCKQYYWKFCKPSVTGVKMMVFNSRGEILLVRIGYMNKYWVIPGGVVEKNETYETAAKRELYEEIGVHIEHCSPAFTLFHDKQGKKDTVHYFIAFSNVTDFIIDDEEIIDVGWFSLDNLPIPRASRIEEAIEKYRART